MLDAPAAPGATVLVVDDEPSNLRLLQGLLKIEGYTTLCATSGAQALALVERQLPDIILLDIMMPGLDGYEVARRLKARPETCGVPIIMVTALDDRASRLKALEAGAEEFLVKPIDRIELSIRLKNMLRLKEYSDLLASNNRKLEEEVSTRTAQLQESYHETVFTMTLAAEHKDEDTGLHVARVSHYCRALAERLGLDNEFCDCIFYASPMHDVGKIGIPDSILRKPAALLPQEFEIIKTHCALGQKILALGHSPYLRMGAEIALCHHERWDGSGYPQGIGGEQIPLSARLMSMADQYDALRARRPYKPALDHATTVRILTQGDGRTLPQHFDPAMLAAFKNCAGSFQSIYAAHAE